MRAHATCQVCGTATGAMGVWHGAETTIAVCGQCARHVLPALLADAIDHPASAHRVREVWRDGERHYLRAMLARLWDDEPLRRAAP